MADMQQIVQVLQAMGQGGNYGTSNATPYAGTGPFSRGLRTSPQGFNISGLGGLGNTLVNQGLNGLVLPHLQNWASDQGYMIGAVGGGTWNVRDVADARRQQAQLKPINEYAQTRQDMRIREYAEATIRAMSPDATKTQRAAQLDNFMGYYDTAKGIPFFNDIADAVMPGGSIKSFSDRLVGARLNQNLGQELNPDEINRIVTNVENRFSPAGVEDRSFTRGFTRGQFGKMAEYLGNRGVLKEGGQVTEQLGEFADVLDATRDIMGPNSTMDKLLKSVTAFTSDGVGKANMKKMTQELRQLRTLGQDMGISGEGLVNLAEGMGIRAEGMGLLRGSGTGMAIDMLQNTQALTKVMERDKSTRFNRMTRTDMTRHSQASAIRGASSKFARSLAVGMQMMEDAGGDLTAREGATEQERRDLARFQELSGKQADGTITDAEIEELQGMLAGNGIYDIMGAAGVERKHVASMFTNKELVAAQIEKSNISGSVSVAQAKELRDRAASYLTANEDVDAAAAADIVRAATDTSGGFDEKFQAVVDQMREAGIEDPIQEARTFFSTMDKRTAKELGLKKTTDSWLASTGKDVRSAQLEVQASTEAKAKIDQQFAEAGKGRRGAGFGGVFRSAMSALKTSDSKTDFKEFILKAIGAEKMTPEIKKAIDNLVTGRGGELQDKYISLSQELKKAEAAGDKDKQARIQKELETIWDGLVEATTESMETLGGIEFAPESGGMVGALSGIYGSSSDTGKRVGVRGFIDKGQYVKGIRTAGGDVKKAKKLMEDLKKAQKATTEEGLTSEELEDRQGKVQNILREMTKLSMDAHESVPEEAKTTKSVGDSKGTEDAKKSPEPEEEEERKRTKGEKTAMKKQTLEFNFRNQSGRPMGGGEVTLS